MTTVDGVECDPLNSQAPEQHQDSDNDPAWDAIKSLIGTVKGPRDWASRHDHYLYGNLTRETDYMSDITTHHDGHGVNESIIISRFDEGPGSAPHAYSCSIATVHNNLRYMAAQIQFQKVPVNDPDSTPGVTEIAILAIVLDRLISLQGSESGCRDNFIAITHIEHAISALKDMEDKRAAREVDGREIVV